MAVILAVAAVLLLGASAMIGPDADSPLLRSVYIIAQWTGPLILILLVAQVFRRRLSAWAERRLIEVAGPALIRSMPPRTVLGSLLPWVYGDRTSHQDVLTGVLGGPGRDPYGRDTAVSRSTTASFRIRALDDQMALSEATWTHEFSGVRNNHKYVLFGTVDREIPPLVMSERVFPLFELWTFENEDELEDFVPNLRNSMQVGITYRDDAGVAHRVEPRRHHGEEVALRHYDHYLRLPDRIDRKNLRIVQLDLYDLAHPDHVVTAIETLSVKASVISAIDAGYVTWSPPHPCFLERVTFDVRELGRDSEELVFLVVPSMLRLGGIPMSSGWIPGRDQIEVPVRSWMLPGHGVTLLWRPSDGVEPNHEPQRR